MTLKFIMVLYKIVTNKRSSSVISFDDKGTRVIIKNQMSFNNYYLKKYFDNIDFNKFHKVLNNLGFRRIPNPNKFIFMNRNFSIYGKDLHKIKPKKYKKKIEDNSIDTIISDKYEETVNSNNDLLNEQDVKNNLRESVESLSSMSKYSQSSELSEYSNLTNESLITTSDLSDKYLIEQSNLDEKPFFESFYDDEFFDNNRYLLNSDFNLDNNLDLTN